MITLETPIDRVPKISRAIVPALKRLGIHTVADLLLYLPSRYEDFSVKKMIADTITGETVTVQGTIRTISQFRTKTSGKLMIQASITDESGSIQAIWFNQPYLLRTLKKGDALYVSGKAELQRGGMTLINPSYEKKPSRAPYAPAPSHGPLHTGGLVAVYPETRGLSSRWMRYLISLFLPLRLQMADPLPEDMRKEFDLPELPGAVEAVHHPASRDDAATALRRFEFEELLAIQLYSLRERMAMKQAQATPIPARVEIIKQFVGSLPFALTDAQRRSLWEIMKDMEQSIPMNRLLEGDVGSGKTVVAAGALLLASLAGKRCCLLAPTEILAKQHAQTLEKFLSPFGVRVGVYTSSEKRIPAHSSVFVGTHALLQKNIRISNLALVIVDEQHRFGVEQRAALIHHHKETGMHPHFLSMTATPIPRTLALTVFGDLDVSVLDEMPKSRKKIITAVVNPHARNDAYECIRQEVKSGRQVFVICPRIEIAETAMPSANANKSSAKKQQASLLAADVKTVKEEAERLGTIIFPDLRVAMLHGKMKAQEKSHIMRGFKEGAIDILVSTSVVEVGVDVPNASVMMIEGAERFGLAQLHQFRGRVGRASEQSYCFLFPTETGMASERLQSLVTASTGFELAEIDLKLRGPGDFLGTRQWGFSPLGISALANPLLVRDVRKAAAQLLQRDPALRTSLLLSKKIEGMARMVHRE